MATRGEWAERVDRWQKSGLSAKDFAARERIESRRLVWWRWKLQSSSPEQRFLPVRVVDAAARPAGASVPLEIALPNGRVVRVPEGFDPAMLERVLSIASEGTSC